MMTLGKYDAAVSPSFVEGITMEGPIGHIGKLRMSLLLSMPFYNPNLLGLFNFIC